MKKTQTILAYYSVFLATLLIGWSLFFSSQPTGYVQAALLLPISVYFWVLISGKMPHNGNHSHDYSSENASSEKLIGLLLAITLTIATSSILTYIAFSDTPTKSESSEKIAGMEATLREIQSDISHLQKNTDTLEKIDVKVNLIQSALLKMENKTSTTGTQNDILGVIDSLNATPEASITPINNINP